MSDRSSKPARLMDKYRAVFLQSSMGLEVLGDILHECHFGCTFSPGNDLALGEYNAGMTILGKCGIFGPATLQDVVKSLASVIPDIKEEEE